MKKIIYCIGGGDIGKRETYEIDSDLVSLTGKEHPNVLFVPTASLDNKDYIRGFSSVYEEIGASVKSLCLYSPISTKEIDNLLAWADIIYVGGGNTGSMIEKWKEFGLNRKLKKAYEKGAILAGLSAGASCWYEKYLGINDDTKTPYWGKGLGLLKGAFTPHYNEPNRQIFDQGFKNKAEEGTACENGVALIYENEKFIGNWKAYGWVTHAYRLTYSKSGKLTKKEIA